jgi:hypothetical protein
MGRRVRRFIVMVGHCAGAIFILPFAAGSTVTLEWDPNPETNLSGYRVHYGSATRRYQGVLEVPATSTSVTVSNLDNNRRYFFSVAAFNAGGSESALSDEVSAITMEIQENRPGAIVFNDESGALSGIAVISLPLRGTLLGAGAALTYTPNRDFYGRDRFDLIPIRPNSTSIPATVLITVRPENAQPTLDPIPNVAVSANAGPQVVRLSGISSGAGYELQNLVVTATSSDPAILGDPEISYSSPKQTGSLILSPVANVSGNVLITVTVNDGQAQNNIVTRSFLVEIGLSNSAPLIVNAGPDKLATWPSPVELVGSVAGESSEPWLVNWRKLSGPGTVQFSPPNSLVSISTFSHSGRYVLQLTAGDGQRFERDDVVVEVLHASGPVVSNIVVIAADARTLVFGFTSDAPALGSVEYGTTSLLGATANGNVLTNQHVVALTNLQPAASYLVRFRAVDKTGNESFTETMTASTPPVTILSWQAEAGALTFPMAVGASGTASNGAYVSSLFNELGSVTYSFEVPVPSQYHAWCRLWTPVAGFGSFYATLDGQAKFAFDAGGFDWVNGWRWIPVNDPASGWWLPNLNAGIHQLVLRTRQAGVLLDQFILSNDPTWMPGGSSFAVLGLQAFAEWTEAAGSPHDAQ